MVGLSTVQWAGVVTLAVGFTFPVLVWYVWEDRSKPGVFWFLCALAASLGWCVVSGFARLLTDPTVTEFLVGLSYWFTGLAVACWVTVIFEHVTGRRVSPVVVSLLLVVPTVEQLLLWWAPTRELVHGPDSFVDGAGIFFVDPGLFFLFTMVYFFSLILCGLGMLVPAWIRSEGSRRTQTGVLLVATLVAILLSTLTLSDVWNPFHPFLIMFPAVNSVLAIALVRYRLFEVTTVGREVTVREMDDAMVILDTSAVVTDANPAARALFDLTEHDLGNRVEDVFADSPTLVDTLLHDAPFQTERSISIDGTDYHFDVRVTSLSDGAWEWGTVVVLRDVTSLKRREEELALLKQVFSRILRHNLRNELTVMQGYAEAASKRSDGELERYVQHVLDSSHNLLRYSEKANRIESAVDDTNRYDLDLASVVSEAVASATAETPDVSVETRVPAAVSVVAHHELPAAIQELIDNTITHAPPGDTPRIDIHADVTDSGVLLVVEDESGGLDEYEIEMLEQGTEQALEHGSGVGLWLVRFVVEWSRGELNLENTGTGTRATIKLERADL